MPIYVPLNTISGEWDSPVGSAHLTAAEKTLLTHADLTVWLDWKRVEVDGGAYIYQWVSRRRAADGSVAWAGVTIDTKGLVYYSTTDSQYGVRSGYLADGTINTNHTTLYGNSNFILPTGNWYVADLGVAEVPASIAVRWATSDATDQLAAADDSSGRLRRYANYSTSVTQSATGVNVGALMLREDTWDGTTWVTYKDRTSVATATPTLPTLPSRVLRLNSVNNGGSETGLAKGYREMFVVGTNTSSLRTAVKAVVAERHPGLSLAA